MKEILRLGHRIERDKRITSHVALTARAFGISHLYYSGQKDSHFETSLKKVSEEFGGSFKIEHINKPLEIVKKKKKEGVCIVHLTMYGIPFEEKLRELEKEEKILFVVGGEKVEGVYYQMSNMNVSVSHQPISEVSALGILLYSLYGFASFKDGKREVLHSENGKKIVKKK